MSEDLSNRFAQAAEEVTQLKHEPDNDVKLRLYALENQATSGDCTGAPPSMTDFVNRARYDAWHALRGLSRDEAMAEYVRLVDELVEAH